VYGGRAQAHRLSWITSEGRRSGEHRLRYVVKHATGVRTLSRSNTLKLRAHGLSEIALDDLSTNPVLSKRTLYINANQVLSGLSPGSPLWFAIGANWMMLGKSREVVQKKVGHVQTDAVHQCQSGAFRPLARVATVVRHKGKLDDVGEIP
jgi:hypothetical protein